MFVSQIETINVVKYSEFFRMIKKEGWKFKRQAKGSHEIWEKGNLSIAIPNHGSKEMSKGLERSLKNKWD